MLAYLLGQERVGDELYQVVDGVDAGMDRLKPLYLLSDGQGVGHVGQIALMIGHHEPAWLARLLSQRKWVSNSQAIVLGIHFPLMRFTPIIIKHRESHWRTTGTATRILLLKLNSVTSEFSYGDFD